MHAFREHDDWLLKSTFEVFFARTIPTKETTQGVLDDGFLRGLPIFDLSNAIQTFLLFVDQWFQDVPGVHVLASTPEKYVEGGLKGRSNVVAHDEEVRTSEQTAPSARERRVGKQVFKKVVRTSRVERPPLCGGDPRGSPLPTNTRGGFPEEGIERIARHECAPCRSSHCTWMRKS